jgi:hypothetical protein
MNKRFIEFEALRLGCETYANDLNPVAVFIQIRQKSTSSRVLKVMAVLIK